MGKSSDAGRVRLTVPADEGMLDVVRAAVRALCARVGLIDAEVEATRAAVGDAFLELIATTDADEVVLEADVTDFDLAIAVAARGEERRVEARR